MNTDKVIRVGSRKSELALIQTKHVISRLQKLYPNKTFEIHTMSTIGDRVLNVSLPKIGEKSLFTRDLEDALRNGGVDFVVHSLKDLPTALPPGMAIGSILEREDSRDALVLNEKYKGNTIDTLPKGCVIGTSSLRRTAQLRRLYPDLEICDIRGNLNTRLAKLDAESTKYAGVILAQAGLVRMGWNHRISQILEPTHILYAVGQGALAVECRSNDENILTMLQMLMCLPTTCRILAERSFLKTLGGGCSAPVAVVSTLNGILSDLDKNKGACLQLTGAVWSLDGTLQIDDKLDCSLEFKNNETIDKFIEENSDSNSNEVSPTKRVKYDNNDRKQRSPTIINDDLLAGGDSTNITDIQYLIDIHGELFKKCPFYSRHHHERDSNGNNNSVVDECPLKIPVGQDFMGKCPYVDTNEKVKQSLQCPITGKTQNDIENEIKKQSIKEGPTTSKCPFSGDSNTKSSDTKKLIGVDACPFIQKTVEMIEYADEEKPIGTKVLPILIDDSNELFCGLYRHKCYNHDLFAKCENLGKDLANNLIGKGALNVMKCAQNEIHSKS